MAEEQSERGLPRQTEPGLRPLFSPIKAVVVA